MARCHQREPPDGAQNFGSHSGELGKDSTQPRRCLQQKAPVYPSEFKSSNFC